MANIELISTSIVQAARNEGFTQKERILLSSTDLQFLFVGATQLGLLFPKPKPSELKFSCENLIQHLKNSLSRTLDFFFPLAGRLGRLQHSDNTANLFIDCNNAGVHFDHALAENVAISDILEPIYFPPIIQSLFPMNGMRSYEGFSAPLFGVQVTELADGIFIGFTLNHSVADGTSFWHFINSWSEISRGFDNISKLPVFENWIRSESYCPAVSLPSSITKDTYDKLTPPFPLQERVFHFNKENIARLKSRANMEAGTEKISSLQSLLAHVWRSVIRCQQLDSEQETNFNFPFGLRSRLEPPIPEFYFGNAIGGGNKVTLKVKELLENGLGYAALHVHKTVAGCTNDKLKDIVESQTSNSDPTALSLYHERTTFVLSGSPRFDVYGNDFGWGRPTAVRSGPSAKFDGLIYVFPGSEEGSIDIEICNLPEFLQAMGNDSEFMDVVTI